MRSCSRFIQNRYLLRPWHRKNLHLWYCYHRLFYGSLIFCGRKAKAFKMLLSIKYHLKLKKQLEPSSLFLLLLIKVSPSVILFPIKQAGIVQRAPFPISRRKQVTFAIKWIVKLLKDRSRVVSISSIIELLLKVLENKGDAIMLKQDVYEVASSNRHLIKFYR